VANDKLQIDVTKTSFAERFVKAMEGFIGLMGRKNGEPEDRAMDIGMIYGQIDMLLWEEHPYAWIMDLYLENDGEMFAILLEEGKLYRAGVTVSEGQATLGEWTEVEHEFKPIPTRTTIRRQEDGRVRWISVSNSAVINRNGEIDTMELFDNFVKRAEETGEYPIRQFYHLGEKSKTGQADLLARDGYLYITSGLYDEDNVLAEFEIAAREKEPEYWGESIGFEAIDYEMVEVADGVSVPAYTDGVHREISTLPADGACALFTNGTVIRQKEVVRMKSKVKEALLRLTDGDEEFVEEFESGLDSRNREIEEEGLIVREGEEEEVVDPEIEEPEIEEPEDDEPEEEAPEDEEEEDEGEEEEEGLEVDGEQIELEIDDEVIGRVAETVVQSDRFREIAESMDETMAAITDSLQDLRKTVERMDAAFKKATGEMRERIEAVEMEDEAKQKEWLEDLPRNTKRGRVTFRPREERAGDEDGDEETLSNVAEKTLEGLPKVGA